MRRNAGPIYRIKKADADKMEEELDQLTQRNNGLISAKLEQIDGIENNMAMEINSREESTLNGLASRMEALNRLTASSPAIWMANWFIILLFIAIETAPVLVKLISSRGPYDFKLQAIEYDYKANSIESLAKTNARIKKRAIKIPETERDFITNHLDLEINKI